MIVITTLRPPVKTIALITIITAAVNGLALGHLGMDAVVESATA